MNRYLPSALFTALMISSTLTTAGQIATSFTQAKNNLYKGVFDNQGATFYTGCSWNKKKVDLASCGLENSFPTKEHKRALRVEAEHVIPASWFYKQNGTDRKCYLDAKQNKASPREYCQENDTNYSQAHNDLVNLRVAVGAINGQRSNKPFAESLSGDNKKTYRGNGKTMVITSRIVIPDTSIRGDIARIAFYMRDTYGVNYAKRQLELFKQWDQEDPVSDEERSLNKRIIKIQGHGNPYVENK
ncbi:endonuclease [Thiomicrorhabdus cannonii]|uniref:endonuclease n=1 Tax=Thiomicrorhabdus cannonii TaxID=2748011 RepID=UPI0015BDFC27|nr:endonuclease [Thiomicrorhabdus cannonii]